MVVCAWNLCRKCAGMRLTGRFSIATSCIVRCMSNRLPSFLNLSSFWFQKNCKRTLSLSDPILEQGFLTTIGEYSAGAWGIVNCLKKIGAVIVPKKNTPICRRGVGCGATEGLRLEMYLLLIVAGFAKLINHFACRYCYV